MRSGLQSSTVPDDKDIADSVSHDVNDNAVPNKPEEGCNANGLPDVWELAQARSIDINGNDIPDDCGATAEFR